MNIYYFMDPFDSRFAEAGRRGSWSHSAGVCPECGASRARRVTPLVIEWLPGSDKIGDFTWPGLGDEVVVAGRVRAAFETEFGHSGFYPVKMYQAEAARQPTRPTKRTRSRVWLPYEGPQLWDMQPEALCKLDLGRSGVSLERLCSTCGTRYYKIPHIEARHLVVDSSTWDGQQIFRIVELPSLVYCTQRVKDFVEAQAFTNVSFRLDGEIPE